MELNSETGTGNFGRSVIVPSVQELAKHPILKIPLRYQRTDRDPLIVPVPDGESEPSVAVVDIHRLVLGDSASAAAELQKLHSACSEWGFFQVCKRSANRALICNYVLFFGNYE